MSSIVGWDIGGVNTKAALVVDGAVRSVVTRPFAIQDAPDSLIGLLTEIDHALIPGGSDAHAITMTAELSQMFRTKREGVKFIVHAAEQAFARRAVHVFTTNGEFLPAAVAWSRPLEVAAANWVATAALVARYHPNVLLVDIGTTTTDIIPISKGCVAALGRTDPARLSSGELVYSGAVRTPVEALVRAVPLGGGDARVSAEGFALAGDAHRWLGTLAPDDYGASTPDGRGTTRTSCGERLARVVCGDHELIDNDAIDGIARAIADAQIATIADAIREVLQRHPSIDTAVVTGLGAFIGARAASAVGLRVEALSDRLGAAGARSAPATAVALLLHDALSGPGHRREPRRGPRKVGIPPPGELTVVKIGGSLLSDPAQWQTAVEALRGAHQSCAAAGQSERLLVIPGGGPFADAVRGVYRQFHISESAAHWMAIAAMNQHAFLLTETGDPFVRFDNLPTLEHIHRRGGLPVFFPHRWLSIVDPLPHSWDVTSDSIAAWVAGQLNATRLIVVKSAGATGPEIVDPWFERTLPAGVAWTLCDATGLAAQLAGAAPSRR